MLFKFVFLPCSWSATACWNYWLLWSHLFIQMIALRFDVVCTVHYVAVPWYSLWLPQVVAGPHNNAKPECASFQAGPHKLLVMYMHHSIKRTEIPITPHNKYICGHVTKPMINQYVYNRVVLVGQTKSAFQSTYDFLWAAGVSILFHSTLANVWCPIREGWKQSNCKRTGNVTTRLSKKRDLDGNSSRQVQQK